MNVALESRKIWRSPHHWCRAPATTCSATRAYRRLWTSIVISSFGGQVTMLALPLTAAMLLHASPTQMGLLTAMEIVPFVLFSLPAGVWLDRVRKLPVYVIGECTLASSSGSVPLAWWPGWLWIAMALRLRLRPRHGLHRCRQRRADRAHAGRAARSPGRGACEERARELGLRGRGPRPGGRVDQGGRCAGGLAGRRRAGHGLGRDPARHRRSTSSRAAERRRHGSAQFWVDLKAGMRFVARNRLLVSLALVVGCWQACHQAALVVQILFATRTLGLSEQAIGMSYTGMGVGTSSPASSATASAGDSGRAAAWWRAWRSAGSAGRCCRWRRRMPGAWRCSR